MLQRRPGARPWRPAGLPAGPPNTLLAPAIEGDPTDGDVSLLREWPARDDRHQIAAMPRTKIPAVVLTLVPILPGGERSRSANRSSHGARRSPQLLQLPRSRLQPGLTFRSPRRQ
jgi:hypothetical protein